VLAFATNRHTVARVVLGQRVPGEVGPTTNQVTRELLTAIENAYQSASSVGL
jgi:hypothetical protein